MSVFSISLKRGVPARDRLLISFAMIIFALLFYSTGNFGLLNVFDVRRQMQALLFVSVLFMGLLILARYPRLLREPLFLALQVFLAFEFLLRNFLLDVSTFAVASIVVGTLFIAQRWQVEKSLRYVICLAAFFSIMVIIQFLLVSAEPHLINQIGYPYTSATAGDRVVISHPLEYLGFRAPGAEISLFGFRFNRYNSFASEPSVLVYSFLFPGLLALTFRGWLRWLALPILFFVVVLAAPGTVWLSLGLGVCVYPVLGWVGQKRFSALLPFVIGGAMVAYFSFVYIPDFVRSFVTLGEDYSNVSNLAALKEGSATTRLTSIVDGTRFVLSQPMGLSEKPELAAVGLLVQFGYIAGIAGILVGCLALAKLFRVLGLAFRVIPGRIDRLAAALMYGTLIQALFFSGFGWITIAGVMMLAMTQIRFEQLYLAAAEPEGRSQKRVSKQPAL